MQLRDILLIAKIFHNFPILTSLIYSKIVANITVLEMYSYQE